MPFGVANLLRSGGALTVVTWGAMVERCELALERTGIDADLLDLRTLSPWDKQATLASVRKTHRCLIVHEDTLTAGFGAEIAAVLAREAFFDLDAPIERLAMPDVPSPHSPVLLEAVLPSVAGIAAAISGLVTSLSTDQIDVVAPANEEGTKATVLRWCKAAGDAVRKDEPLLELETDKVTVEIPSPATGKLTEILKQPNEEVEPGQILARVRIAEASEAGGGAATSAAPSRAGSRAIVGSAGGQASC